jgi:uncharacterized membrane protein YgcG
VTFVLDSTGTLSSQAKTELESIQTRFPLHIVFKDEPSQAVLGKDMDACVVTPSTICIGVDPGHRWTSSRFGVDSGIKSGDFAQVSRAGNLDFKQGNWVGGVKAIVSRAELLSTKSNVPTAIVIQNPIVEHPVPVWPFFLGFGVLAAIGGYVLLTVRRRTKKALEEADKAIQDVREEAAELTSRNIKDERWERSLDESLAKKAAIPAKAEEAAIPVKVEKKDFCPVCSTPIVNRKCSCAKSTTTSHPTRRRAAPVPAPPSPVVVVGSSSGSDLVTGIVVGEALAANRESYHRHRTPTPIPAPRRDPTPEPSSSGGDDSSFSSFSSGGSDSNFGGGGGGGDFSGGGGDSSF